MRLQHALARSLKEVGRVVGQAWGQARRIAGSASAFTRRGYVLSVAFARSHKPLALAAAGVALLGLLAASGSAGYLAAERDLPAKVQARIINPLLASTKSSLGLEEDVVPLVWETINTNGHILETTRFSVRRAAWDPLVFQLASVGDHLLFASRHGQLGYLDPSYALHALELRVPMRLQELDASELGQDPIFEYEEMRVTDLLSIQTGPQTYDLYAAYFRYMDGCFELAVSRTPLMATADAVTAVTGAWEDVYAARPCMPPKYTGMRFAGHEGGGRLGLLDGDTLLLSVGVFQLDDVARGQMAGQDPSIDLGKIIAISLSTREARFYATGFRNPQGLLVARDGRVWETEHGPQGGDEVNLVVEGANYGWPVATYGMDYSVAPRDWPFTETPGRQDGFAAPAFAFTPSIGISNIVQPDTRQFPRWRDHLVTASLTGGALFVLHVEGDRIVSAEPIAMGDRLRDIVSLSDGRLALATDSGAIVLIRNAEVDHGATPAAVAGVQAITKALPADDLGPGGDNFAQRELFYWCGTCHSLNGDLGIGPPLDGLMGRRVGSVPGYGYSETLRNFDGVWTPRLFRSFLLEPERQFAGTAMPRVDIPDYEIESVTRYLAGVKRREAQSP